MIADCLPKLLCDSAPLRDILNCHPVSILQTHHCPPGTFPASVFPMHDLVDRTDNCQNKQQRPPIRYSQEERVPSVTLSDAFACLFVDEDASRTPTTRFDDCLSGPRKSLSRSIVR
jgi:hypothetical protein